MKKVCGVEGKGIKCQVISMLCLAFSFSGELGKSCERLLIFSLSPSLKGIFSKMEKIAFTRIHLDGQTSCLGKCLGYRRRFQGNGWNSFELAKQRTCSLLGEEERRDWYWWTQLNDGRSYALVSS